MSDTPRTDAIAHHGYELNTYVSKMTDHARQLEREVAELTACNATGAERLRHELEEKRKLEEHLAEMNADE